MLANLHTALLFFICLVLSITLHEFGHAWMANKLGDPLPRALGRVTLNPFAHADKLGTFILPAICVFLPALCGASVGFVFGWGKPVLISLPNAKTRKRDEMLTAFAGPAVNLILAIFGSILYAFALYFCARFDVAENVFAGTQQFFSIFISLNICLMLFNLIPVPPLDGSRILRHLINMREEVFNWLSRYSLWILLALIMLPSPSHSILGLVFYPIAELFLNGAGFIVETVVKLLLA